MKWESKQADKEIMELINIMTTKEKIVQKLYGLFFIIASIFPIWLENNGTVALLFVPFGLYLIFTKKKWLVSMNDFKEDF